MRVDVVVCSVAVLALAHKVREFAEREEIDLLFKEKAVVEREPPAGFNFGADGVDGGHAVASESSGPLSHCRNRTHNYADNLASPMSGCHNPSPQLSTPAAP